MGRLKMNGSCWMFAQKRNSNHETLRSLKRVADPALHVPLVEYFFPSTIYQTRTDVAEMHLDLMVARLVFVAVFGVELSKHPNIPLQ